jgi:cytochrome P450
MTHEPVQQEDYKLFCRQQLTNPYPLFHGLRENDPIHWCESLKCWLGFRYDDTFAALNNPRLLVGRQGLYDGVLTEDNRKKGHPLVKHIDMWLQNQNAPRHARLRRLAGIAFTPRMVKDLAPRIRGIVRDRLEHIREMGECDFMAEFCYWVPATVICDMLGLPHSDHDQFRAWVSDLMSFASSVGPSLNDAVDPADQALQGLKGYFDKVIADRKAHPGQDLISALASAEEDGDRLTHEELFGMCVFLFVAGHETTMSLLGNGTMLLLSHQDQLQRFDPDDPKVVRSAIEEFVRYESPVTRAVRVAGEDMQLRGRTIREGETVIFLLSAANRDPAQFPDPDRLDIRRQPNKHLGFGWGRHFCIGAELARLEAMTAFPMIVKHLPNLRMTSQQIQWRGIFGIRSLQSLPVAVG